MDHSLLKVSPLLDTSKQRSGPESEENIEIQGAAKTLLPWRYRVVLFLFGCLCAAVVVEAGYRIFTSSRHLAAPRTDRPKYFYFPAKATTDRDYTDDPKNVKISEEEIAYLCNAASEYFAEPVKKDDIVWSYSAVRPLYDDGASKAQEATRDYVLKIDQPAQEGFFPRLSVVPSLQVAQVLAAPMEVVVPG